ncbi:DUF6848 family protein [Deinococcus cellulosilyticus]|uniref:DUF6848 domain-containing protein n=1 Tax=Deinococcus cellulosilyticus (strain DSM 18568 / NBRC 106333 / KACC 11606 / 5516J-15) TaxID=1223518 RepID=A0A511MWR9_DEIC1|nr:hypothetical protein [Deinococcus cellulosilyticus]GEM44831.1 hypothetical protein DC3_04660 [Deinococcus cellulosilyticus NBRC 106333 = KACC 11606]
MNKNRTITIQISDDTNDTVQRFRFREPTTPVVGAYFSGAGKNMPKASLQLCADTILPEDKDAWNAAVEEKPGYAAQAAGRILEDLGYGVEAKKVTME